MFCRRWGFVYGLLLAILALSACNVGPDEPRRTPRPITAVEEAGPLRLFFVRTYGQEDPWSNRVRTGILERLAQSGYDRPSQTLVFSDYALDIGTVTETARLKTRAAAVMEEIRAFDPDVVIVADDEGARQVIRGYPDPNQPFVFCGLNGSAWEHGLSRPNVTGVLESVYPLQTVRLAATMAGRGPEDVLFLSDRSIASDTTMNQLPLVLLDDEFAPVKTVVRRQTSSWSAWQTSVLEEADDFDMVLLGYYGSLLTEEGEHLSRSTVLRWTLEHSSVPVYGLHLHTVDGGAVGGLVVSGYEQGRRAAEMALEIYQGASPGSLSHRTPERNVLAVNVAAARYWDLDVPLEMLVSARVERYFPIALGGQ